VKVLMILSNPFMVDPRVYKEAKALVEAGHEVAVVVWDRRGEYSSDDTVDGIHVIRIHNSLLMRFAGTDVLRNPLWWRQAYKKGLELYRGGYEFDVVHCHDLDTLQAGVWLKKKLGVKLVYDAHELWGYLIEGDVPRFVVNRAFRMEEKLVQRVDHIVTVDEPFRLYFSSLTDTPVTIVMNCKDLRYDTYEPSENDVFTLIYIGGMKRKRFFPDIIDVAGSLDGVRLQLAGKKEDLYHEMEVYARRYNNVSFHGTLPFDQILPRTRAADATFILVDPSSSHYQRTLFNKQFEAMVCGRPIIVTKGTYAAKMTEELECGLTVDYNEKAIREAIIRLRDDQQLREKLGRNALDAAQKRYNWQQEKKNILKVYEELA